MAPKNKDAGKGKGKAKADADEGAGGGGKLKAAQSINVRHILCEKHSKKEEALAKLRDGAKFDEVAREYSEDKARQVLTIWYKEGCLDGKREAVFMDFEKVAYELQPGTIGEVKTSHGYHIILVEGRK